MAHILATNITSPLGMTTAENYRAVKAGRSSLCRYEGLWGLPEAFTASLFTDGQQQALAIHGLTRFESLVVRSVSEAMAQLPQVDIAGENVVFILSTTKAGLEQQPGETARRIATHLGVTSEPIVVCNACISGVAAIILAKRLLDGALYDYAVVCGADVQSRFTVSGFQSLKALSADECRPFDIERMGLNLGEAAATMVLSREMSLQGTGFCVERGAIRNDAFHVSSPSKNGEGAWLALKAIEASLPPHHPSSITSHPSPLSNLAFINAHGTATMFNDQMEALAIERAGLSGISVNALKGYYGHTLGAAGVLETVISLAALTDHTILATRGFQERGVSGKISVTTENSTTAKTSFVKMISGFGGGNAAILVAPTLPTLGPMETKGTQPAIRPQKDVPLLRHTHRVTINPAAAIVDGKPLPDPVALTDLYKSYVDDYPKYYKMDGLSRLGFVASELLLRAEGKNGGHEADEPSHEDRAIVLFSSSSSIATDRKYIETIDHDKFFPSPSLFIYTLPNIVTGEIAMRNGYHGETSLFILPRRDDSLMQKIIQATFQDSDVKSVITGWVDYYSDKNYKADLAIIK